MEYEMPFVETARKYKTQHITQLEGMTTLNQINGIWARVHEDHIDFGLSPMAVFLPVQGVDPKPGDPASGSFIKNPYGDAYLDMAAARLVAADLPASARLVAVDLPASDEEPS